MFHETELNWSFNVILLNQLCQWLIYIRIQILIVYNSMSSGKCTHCVCIHCVSSPPPFKISIILENLFSFPVSNPQRCCRQSLIWFILPHFGSFVCSKTSCKWNHILCNLLCLALFTQHNIWGSSILLPVSEVHFYYWITVLCVNMPQSCLFIGWWIFWLYLVFWYYE